MFTELPVATRHRRNVTEKLLKATLNPNNNNNNICNSAWSVRTRTVMFLAQSREAEIKPWNKTRSTRNTHFIIEPPHDKTNKVACAPSEDRSAWTPAQSDQSLRCLHEETLGP